MPTSFNVVSLGNFASIDPVEGDRIADNAGSLVGQTFGNVDAPLLDNFANFGPGTTGFGGGSHASLFDQDNTTANDTFSINGGPDQVFDSMATYNATITYTDGSTATITAVIFQDDSGNTYLAPETSFNSDQSKLEAAPIRSLTLDSLSSNNFAGMTAERQSFDYVTCFVRGTSILTGAGEVAVEDLCVGDEVETVDNGLQTIRWIGRATHITQGNLIPVRIEAGALGEHLPTRALVVSPQHRILVRSKIAHRITGSGEVLIPAKKLIGLPGIELAKNSGIITYFHILCDRHEIIFAEGACSETLLLGPLATSYIEPDVYRELIEVFPNLARNASKPARLIPTGREIGPLMVRHQKNSQPVFR